MRGYDQPFAPDPALPARDELLDPGAMGARFARVLGTDGPVRVEDCRREWARYEPRHSLLMVYRARVDGAERLISAHAFADRRDVERALERSAPRAVSTPPLRPFVADAALNAVYWAFPNDRKIVALSALTGPSAQLDAMVGRPVEPQIVAYAPARAATARCVDRSGDTVAYAKAFGDAGDARHAARMAEVLGAQAAAQGSRLRLPRALAFSPADRLVVSEAFTGPRIGDAASDDVAMRRLGDALASFHQLVPPAGLPEQTVDEVVLRRAADRVACGDPASAERAAALADELLARRPQGEARVCLHGDLNVRNVILDGDRAALIDLDDVSVGPAASDLGRTLAGLRSRRQIGALDAAGEARLAAALLEGYAAVRPLPSDEALRWHTAATLLVNRARAAVVWVNDRWARRLSVVLADVSEVLG